MRPEDVTPPPPRGGGGALLVRAPILAPSAASKLAVSDGGVQVSMRCNFWCGGVTVKGYLEVLVAARIDYALTPLSQAGLHRHHQRGTPAATCNQRTLAG